MRGLDGKAGWLAIAALCALGACTPNAVLEMHLTLPARPAGDDPAPIYYVVQVRGSEGHPFDVEWRDNEDVAPLLLGASELTDQVSVVTSNFDQDVHVRVAFCSDPQCDSNILSAQQLRFVLERPFFPYQVTEWHHHISEIPGSVGESTPIPRCAIRGCVTGDQASDYCLPSGVHPCE